MFVIMDDETAEVTGYLFTRTVPAEPVDEPDEVDALASKITFDRHVNGPDPDTQVM